MYVKSLAWESTDLCYGVLCGFFFPLFAKLSAISEENDEKWLYQSANSEFGQKNGTGGEEGRKNEQVLFL
jgi:hypothetical protein